MKELPRTPLLNKSLYPLHLRRGAVSPASFSLRSASTASSLNALPRGYNELCNALSGKGPIILLSDQASVQSLCSLHSRMTCSCSSLKSVGSDGLQGAAANADAGSDGSLVSSPPAKVDGMQVTLSVPVECHGKRRNSNGHHGLLATENGKCRGDTKETLLTPVVSVPIERGRTDINKKDDMDKMLTNHTSSVAVTENTRKGLDNINLNSPNIHCLETGVSPFTFKNTKDVENLPLQKDDELDASQVKLPVKPVPVVGRAVSAYSLMEYRLYKDVVPNNGESPECQDLPNTNNDKNSPTRRHSAFTLIDSTSSTVKARQGRLSTGCMRENVTECEPLINGNVGQACPNDVFIRDEEGENVVSESDQRSVHTLQRLRKSGVSVCYLPTNSSQRSEDSTVPKIKEPSTENTDEDTWLRPIHPCSSNGCLLRVTTHCPNSERTSRV